YWFERTDIDGNPRIKADIDHVTDISRGTTITQGEVKVHTVEHVLSALAGLEIDNCVVELDGIEPPVVDGSSRPFVDALLEAGIVEQDAPKEYLEINKTLIFHDEEKGVDLVIVPSDEFRITYMVDYRNPALGTQYTSMYSLQEEYKDEFSEARTFAFLSEIEELKRVGLIKGASLETGLVIEDRDLDEEELDRLKEVFDMKGALKPSENGLLDNRPLRFYNEPVRHKVVDLIGDFALLGISIRGHVMAARAGHESHVEMVRKMRKIYQARKLTKKYQRTQSTSYVFDIEAIKRILPHRYPFLLVDRILELVPGEMVSGIKNVTANEPFFQGHFPDRPIMPGVLIIEAMGQVGGVLMLNETENPEDSLVYFTKLDNVKFRRMVVPGDTLYMRVELIYFRRGICKMQASAYVDDELAAQAEMQAVIRERE
ncbi:MAG TPA: bifunctional UDP-3-O-[3-hydroxymyristoyl] N-acetylglucosamine deacetylase/3-hydroxyacyl-ACP dehydratase, partial [Bacteroidetes bacterium]|nr:bifunctional UDP-3-O-[3-hydroxymyristoyl] N-acetylglucosamine deacetylase/3-hydroxyacyl-ACP dehydratase [Bacteroidota bacterium]HEX04438.1 bifunctional UDP-3-O-[3-hydroxymyristoyl] N-acetylglucosamine deacetylase/3-hydroxyacyl-ACP dehydratase [Bacteroidota bacterium]